MRDGATPHGDPGGADLVSIVRLVGATATAESRRGNRYGGRGFRPSIDVLYGAQGSSGEAYELPHQDDDAVGGNRPRSVTMASTCRDAVTSKAGFVTATVDPSGVVRGFPGGYRSTR